MTKLSRDKRETLQGTRMHKREHVENVLPPVIDRESRVLLLGSMPSPKSRAIGFYFGNPQNRFWRVMAGLWGENLPDTIDEKRDFCHRHHIALCDVLASCDIVGASDASIENPVPNAIDMLLAQADIVRIFTLGGAATRLYRRFILPDSKIASVPLPSTSPAHACMTLDDLIEAFSEVKEAADGANVSK